MPKLTKITVVSLVVVSLIGVFVVASMCAAQTPAGSNMPAIGLPGGLGGGGIQVKALALADYFIALGKKALLNSEFLAAHQYFGKALEMKPDNPEANFYYSFTRLIVLPQVNERVFNLFVDMGFTGEGGQPLAPEDFDPVNFKAQIPEGLKEFDLVDTFPDGDVFQDVIENEIISQFNAALDNLQLVLETQDFVSYLTTENPFTGAEQIEIDHGDVWILKSFLSALKAKIQNMLATNIDSESSSQNIVGISNLYLQGLLTARYVLEEYPELLHVDDIPESVAARDSLVTAIDSYISGSEFIHAETDDQFDDLLSFSNMQEYLQEEAAFVEEISDIRKSLISEPDFEFSGKLSQFVDAGHFFTNPVDMRAMLDRQAMLSFLNNHFLYETNYALANLSNANETYQEYLPSSNPWYTGEKLDADFTDVSFVKMSLESLHANVLGLLGYNLDIDGQAILIDVLEGTTRNVNYLLDTYPELTALYSTENINLSQAAVLNIAQRYKDTVDFLASEIDDQSDDILVMDDYFWDNEMRYRNMLDGVVMWEETFIDPELEVLGDEFRLNLGEFYINYKNAREYLPEFDENNQVIPGTWPDPTFGGIVPDNEF